VGLGVQPFSRTGEGDAASVPVQKLDADLRLQLRDRLRQRGLRDAQRAGRAGKLTALGDRYEVGQVAQPKVQGRAPCA